MVLLTHASAAVLVFVSLYLDQMKAFLREVVFPTAQLCAAVIATGTASIFILFVFASLASEDQRVYNSCVIKHKSADYCRLVISGR